MFKNVIEKLVQYKLILIIGGFLVVIIVAVLIFTAYASNVKADIKIEVKPTLSLGPCFNNQVAPKTTIVTPTDGTRYTTGDKVSLTGIAVLGCDNSKINDSNLTWYLDSDTTPFATGTAVNLDSIKVGNHSIKLDAVSGKLKGENIVNITAADPKPQVLGIKAPPPAPNHAPTASISSPSDMKVTDLPLDAKDCASYINPNTGGQQTRCSISLEYIASASDPDGDALTYKWNDSILGDMGTGSDLVNTYYFLNYVSPSTPEAHVITLTVTDSRGATVQSQITIYLSCNSLG